MNIFKFGGASVKNAEAVKNLLEIVKKFRDGKLVIVVSAMDKTTNALEHLVKVVGNKEDWRPWFIAIKDFHIKVSGELIGKMPQKTVQLFDELESSIKAMGDLPWVERYDRIVPYGELLSTSIIAEFVSSEIPAAWMDARDVISTDEFHTEANINWPETEKKAKSIFSPILNEKVIITQGFIGSTESGATTTLGREGSDFTGAILANCLEAKSLTVWKDVPGILNADPKLKSDAQQFNEISYREATEMTYYGAKVIHPKTLKPLAQKSIPLIVRSFVSHDLEGTKIGNRNASQTIPTFIFKENQLLFTAEVKDHNFMDEKRLSILLTELDKLNVKINLMQNSALTFSFCMDNKEHKLEPIISALSEHFNISYNRPLRLTTIKNYDEQSLGELPEMKEKILVQKTRNTYQVLHR